MASSYVPYSKKFTRFFMALAPLVFLFSVVVFLFSGFELRFRSEKRACRGGDVASCLLVAQHYDDRSEGIFGFLLSHADTATRYYTLACAKRSEHACERLIVMYRQRDQARNLSVPTTEIADALIGSCIEGVPHACKHLTEIYDIGDWVERRAVWQYDKACAEHVEAACKLANDYRAEHDKPAARAKPATLPPGGSR